MTYQEMLASSDLAEHLDFLREQARDRVVIEFGVRTGVSTAVFLSSAAQVWSCDIDQPRVPESWHALRDWHFIRGSSTDARTASVLPQWCDLLFIDSSHEYEQTLDELAIYWPRIKPGGLALLHDTEWEPIDPDANGGRWCRELDMPGGPVTRAIETFTSGYGLSWVNRSGSFGLGIIRKP